MTEPQTEPETRCAKCGRTFHGQPTMLGKRIACCSATCAAELAPFEVLRLEAWLSRITAQCRGMGADMAASALYTNTLPPARGRRR